MRPGWAARVVDGPDTDGGRPRAEGDHAVRTPIAIEQLSKVYGEVAALSDVSFTARPGRVTGFLGPNGAGKTSTLRVLLGLDAATAGTATIAGSAYARSTDRSPRRRVALGRRLPSRPQRARPPARSRAGRRHPGRARRRRARAASASPTPPTAGRRLLARHAPAPRPRRPPCSATPDALVLDEPINGLDPDGIRWIRGFLRALAAEGRTVLLSSHVLSEVSQTVDDVVVIARGRIVIRRARSPISRRRRARVRVDALDRRRSPRRSPPPAPASTRRAARPRPRRRRPRRRRCGARSPWRPAIALTPLSAGRDGLESVFLASRRTRRSGARPHQREAAA